jgi:hypothetical protein
LKNMGWKLELCLTGSCALLTLLLGFYGFLKSWLIKPYSSLIMTIDFDENACMFGQLVAMIVIALSFLTAFEGFIGERFALTLSTE